MTTANEAQPCAYGYACFADSESDSIAAQGARSVRYHRQFLEGNGIRFGGVFVDPKIWTAKECFFLRPGAQELVDALRPGDHIIVDEVDRILRRIFDWADVRRWCDAHTITLHIADIGTGRAVRTDDSLGLAIMTAFVAGAGLARRRTSKRITADKLHALERGEYRGGPPLLGAEIIRVRMNKGRVKMLDWNPHVRALMGLIVDLHDRQGKSWSAIARIFSSREFDSTGIPDTNGTIDRRTIQRAYAQEKTYRFFHVTDPNGYSDRLLQQGDQYPTLHELEQLDLPLPAPIQPWKKARSDTKHRP